MSNGLNERPYLSIGEVLGLLLEEFPDVTISKIRFLESQGLIEPERTSSGYRKFFDADIDRLRVILREQRENFLPLRVIRDRLETGEIDDSGAIAVPVAAAPARGIRNVRVEPSLDLDDATDGILADDRATVTARHPAAQMRAVATPTGAAAPAAGTTPSPTQTPAPGPAEVYDRAELCVAADVTSGQLDDLEAFGLVSARGSGGTASYSGSDVAVARVAARFLERGIDARHLRGWRHSAEREVGLFDQRIVPLLRQRNPQARLDATALLSELTDLGAELRAALVTSMVRHHFEP